ncbi:MAG: hypothetical protein CPDRYMAC_2253 [uncultured Paraburkholderia sp.]|nr:MAG: hypothetical protein CPDRYDRY_2223 [uncultured Paraburkholderia sp.]CAH2923534.1 MAG: hypothetical protein CPDRYMAC_2253 [uncultured Paraburkholderia sp.]
MDATVHDTPESPPITHHRRRSAMTASTLTIRDLAIIEELDHEAMAAVSGDAKTVNQAIADTVTMLQQIGSGQCEFSGTGKSYVCY